MASDNWKWITENRTLVSAVVIFLLIVAVYFLFLKDLIEKIKVDTTDAGDDFIPDLEAIYNEEVDQGAALTYPPEQYVSYADSIYTALRFSFIDDDHAEAVRILKKMQSDLDVVRLILDFGVRQEYWFGVPRGGAKSLPQWITTNLSDRKVREVNEDYASKNMQFQF